MKIIYVTTAIDAEDYKLFVESWKKRPNPSNQNFHNKMIRALALHNDLEVISIRPFSKKLVNEKSLKREDNKIDNISWHYISIKGNKAFRFIKIKKEGSKVLKKEDVKDSIVLTDTINPNCMNVALKIGKSHKLPVVGICTDSPSNITGTRKSYTLFLLNKASKCQGYIALTRELNVLINENNMAHLIVEGIVENNEDIRAFSHNKPYIFFGGSLLPRYGVYTLIEAFKMMNRDDVDLFIAGHTGNDHQIKDAIKDNPNIHFLGTIDVKEILSYEKGALLNINPRPYSEDLDRFSIPSKTLEYLTSGQVTISVRNTKLQNYFKDEIVWVNNSTAEEIKDALEYVINMDETNRKEIASKAKEKVLSLFSMGHVSIKMTKFLANFSNR